MDISNIKQNSKKNLQKNDLDDVIEFLKKQPGCRTDAVVDEENNLKVSSTRTPACKTYMPISQKFSL